MRAAILAVGSELLGTRRLDTNSLRLTAVLDRYGFELRAKSVAGDSIEEIATEVLSHLQRADLVLITGGLGPTADDVTREAVSRAVGRGMHRVPEVVEAIEARFRSFGRTMPAVNRRQADVIDGASIIANPRGTAPGMVVEHEGKTILLFPGVPYEMEGMIGSFLEPWLAARSGGVGREMAVLKVACLPESAVEERIAAAYAEFGRENITILAKPGEIRLEATAEGTTEARRERLAEMSARLQELAGDAVFSDREEAELPTVVGELLRAAGATLSVAESCTGGLLAERITAIAGSSDYFQGGVVTYSNQWKTRLLGVTEELLAEHGAVSEAVAREMAAGARGRFATDYALSITGVAGPGGGSDEKPVGTVHLALAGPAGVEHRRARFPGGREQVRVQASQLALEMLRRRLLDLPPPTAFGADGIAR